MPPRLAGKTDFWPRVLLLFLSTAMILFAFERWVASGSFPSKIFRTPAVFLSLATMAPTSAGSAPQITVLQAADPSIVAPSGIAINIEARFLALAPLPEEAVIGIFLIDQSGKEVARTENNLNNSLTVLPTTTWAGPIAFMTVMPLPSLPDGIYTIRLGIYRPTGPLELHKGPSVSEDSHFRYAIGAIKIDRSAKAPRPLPAPTLDLSKLHLTFDESFASMSISDSKVNDGSRWYARNDECCMATTDGTTSAMVGIQGGDSPFSLLANGGLNIRLKRTANTWTSGVLTSVDSLGKGFSQQYGYFEMKARVPAGFDTWPAFWMLNTAAKASKAPAGEIDIVEYIANPKFRQYIASTLHDWSNGTTPSMSHHMVSLPSDDLHTYGMMWTAETMTFYFDGSVTLQVPTPSIMKQPYYLLVDLGIGGGWPTVGTPSTNDMQVKYIRAYSQ